MLLAQLLGRCSRPISVFTQRVLLLPPLRPAAFPPCEIPVSQLCGSALPSSGAIFFSRAVHFCMADMSDIVLSIEWVEFIYRVSLRRAPYPPPSDPVSRHRTEIVSSSLDQGSPAERISSSLALCPTFDLASAQSSSPVFGQGFFLPARPDTPDATSGTQPRYQSAHYAQLWSVTCQFSSVS